jgi:two-component system LytT family response regulator/two-component system response regulator LytT
LPIKAIYKGRCRKSIRENKKYRNKSFNLAKIATITTNTETLIPVKHLSNIVLLKPDDIYYIKAELSEAVIRTKDKECISNRKLYEFEDILKYKGFFRVHKSYLVNLTKIKEMKSVEQSKFLITFQDIPDTLKTSRDGTKYLRDYLNI